MRREHFETYFSKRFNLEVTQETEGEIFEGTLVAKEGDQRVPVVRGIPRFTGTDYAENFGIQWNKYRDLQIDSKMKNLPNVAEEKTNLSFNRFWNDTGWKPKDLHGKTILEVGCGAGRFTEIMLDAGANVVSVDLSSAVEANYKSNYKSGRLFICQASVFDLPFEDETFEYVFCFGVIQHTPDPEKAYHEMFRRVKKGGKIAVDCYERAVRQLVTKHALRAVTKNLDPKKLLKGLEVTMPVLRPMMNFKNRVRDFATAGANLLYVQEILSATGIRKRRYNPKATDEWAILNTFDELAPAFDNPRNQEEIRKMVSTKEAKVQKVGRAANGIVACVEKV